MKEIRIRREGVTLDTLLGLPESKRASELLAMAYELNPDIAEAGLFLPLGAVVRIPDEIEVPETPSLQRVVSLFG